MYVVSTIAKQNFQITFPNSNDFYTNLLSFLHNQSNTFIYIIFYNRSDLTNEISFAQFLAFPPLHDTRHSFDFRQRPPHLSGAALCHEKFIYRSLLSKKGINKNRDISCAHISPTTPCYLHILYISTTIHVYAIHVSQSLSLSASLVPVFHTYALCVCIYT